MNEQYKKLDAVVEDLSNIIAQEIADRRMRDTKDVAAYAKTRLYIAIKECLKIQLSSLEIRKAELSKMAQSPQSNGYQKAYAHSELAIIKKQLKEIHLTLSGITDFDEYKQLKRFVREKYGYDALQDFVANWLNEDEYRNRKRTETIKE
jgi:hypothetical protein